jgi:hypothetical protein
MNGSTADEELVMPGAGTEEEKNSNGGGGIGFFSTLLLFMSVVGVMTNVASIAMFMRQKFRKDFHRLLIILAGYDLLVSAFMNGACGRKNINLKMWVCGRDLSFNISYFLGVG